MESLIELSAVCQRAHRIASDAGRRGLALELHKLGAQVAALIARTLREDLQTEVHS